MSDVRMIFETDDTQGDSVSVKTRRGKPDELFLESRDGVYLSRQQVTELRTALGEWLASTAPEPEAAPDEPTDRDVERDAQVAELARVVAEYRLRLDVLDVGTAKALTNAHGRIGRLAARVNQLEADAAKPSPLHQAIADEIRRAAGAR